VLGQRSRR